MASELLQALESEHALIDATLGSLRRYVEARIEDGASAADAAAFVEFFRGYAGHFHHAREEEVLFDALVRQAHLPADRGPIAMITAEHHEIAAMLDTLEPLLRSPVLDEAGKDALRDAAVRYSRALWHHIDAENSVLFPEGEERLRRSGVDQLTGRGPTPQEQALADAAQELGRRYPPLEDPEVYRGDGCVHCPSFGVRCDGLEREWWTEDEWEEFEERAGRGD